MEDEGKLIVETSFPETNEILLRLSEKYGASDDVFSTCLEAIHKDLTFHTYSSISIVSRRSVEVLRDTVLSLTGEGLFSSLLHPDFQLVLYAAVRRGNSETKFKYLETIHHVLGFAGMAKILYEAPGLMVFLVTCITTSDSFDTRLLAVKIMSLLAMDCDIGRVLSDRPGFKSFCYTVMCWTERHCENHLQSAAKEPQDLSGEYAAEAVVSNRVIFEEVRV